MVLFDIAVDRYEGVGRRMHQRAQVNGSPDNKVHEAYIGPTWGRQGPGRPHEPCYQGRLLVQDKANTYLDL